MSSHLSPDVMEREMGWESKEPSPGTFDCCAALDSSVSVSGLSQGCVGEVEHWRGSFTNSSALKDLVRIEAMTHDQSKYSQSHRAV